MAPRPEHLLQQERLRHRFESTMDRLRMELGVHAPRRHLDDLLSHLDDLLEFMDCTWERECFREQIESARKVVAQRHNLRVVK